MGMRQGSCLHWVYNVVGKADNEQVITKTVSAMREEKGNELFGMIPG